ncbi:DUF222 domain-containing protein, partial [Mycolicibacterium flavescens]|uniref:DUF222 domain-containing protein n=1 Tax=Mycolicibacterium flavescens TaxID=1776 RepID=UPI000A9D7557
NAIDAQVVEIVAEIDRDGLLGAAPGVKSLKALVAWRLGMSEANAGNVAAIAGRYDEFPRCTSEMRQGRLSLDQVGVIAQHAGQGSDEHYADFAAVATVRQIRKALSLETKPEPDREPEPEFKRSFSKSTGDNYTTYRITVPNLEAAKVDAALASHR